MTTSVPYDRALEAPILAYLSAAPHAEPPARQLIDAATNGTSVTAEDHLVPGPDGGPPVEITIFRDGAHEDHSLPLVYYLHGGGLIAGTRGRVAALLTAMAATGVAAATAEYRLAPKASFADAVEDSYAGIVALHATATELKLDPDRFVVGGASAGGGLAAAVAITARDRRGPRLAGLLLDSPMLDDRNDTVSAHQFATGGIWSREQNVSAWAAALGEPADPRRGLPPARATSFAGLPPTCVSVGSAELFRDEAVSFAERIWRDGGQAELHVWAGACHAFEALSPGSAIAGAARRGREDWLARTLAQDPRTDGGWSTKG
ncbi:MAG: nlhH 1 [Mycobacterium sp.]|jgi:acetyl esterase/lipase|nr:nlhH 1 [Mycobacterium sp.]